jgi:hypothetical protein
MLVLMKQIMRMETTEYPATLLMALLKLRILLPEM